MLYRYIKEFIAICSYLEELHTRQRNDHFIVDRKELEKLLNQNAYETAINKLKMWKTLHWISTENHRLTKRIYDGQKKSYTACILIDVKVFHALQQLIS